MCGIAGFVGKNPEAHQEQINRMLKTIYHRGPNGNSMKLLKNACIGFNRLAINDLSERGMQPFSVDGVHVFCNGEIYNHQALKQKYKIEDRLYSRSDIEIIPHLYKMLGLSFLEELNGMFSMIIVDERKGEVYVITDRFAQKPLYYSYVNGNLFFSSELKSFLLEFPCEIDKENLVLGLYLGYSIPPLTPVRNISKLEPATILKIKGGKIEKNIWYYLKPFYDINKFSNKEIGEQFFEMFDSSVGLRMKADVDAGAFLSGGIDSSAVALSAIRCCNDEGLHAFSAVAYGEEDVVENINAKRINSDYRKINFHEVYIDIKTYNRLFIKTAITYDEIFFESSYLCAEAIAEEASKYVTIMLDGICGDEMFLGYEKHLILKKIPQKLWNIFSLNPGAIYKFGSIKNRLILYLLALSDVEKCLTLYNSYIQPKLIQKSKYFNVSKIFNTLDELYCERLRHFKSIDLNAVSYLETFSLTSGLQFVITDRSCMAYSIENRSPLADYRIWEKFVALDSEVKLMEGQPKGFVRKMARDMNRLPDYICNVPKYGFSIPFYKIFLSDLNFLSEIIKYLGSKINVLIDLYGCDLPLTIINRWRSINNLNWVDGIHLHQLLAVLVWKEIFFDKKINLNDNPTLIDFMNIK
jgi:asparagine synthase (glutamine-hydrolysing)